MKKIFVITLFAMWICGVCRAEGGPHVPDAVQKALAEKYKITEPSNWVVSEEDGKKVWCTRWKDADGAMHEADFDASGNVVKTARSLKVSELPKAVSAAVEKRFPGGTVTEAKIEEGKVIAYEIRVTDGEAKKRLVVVSPDGEKLEVYNF